MPKLNISEAARENRIKKALEIITRDQLSAWLNNTKWHIIFELIEGYPFKLKLLGLPNIDSNWNKEIVELEKTAVLTDNYPQLGFVAFREIEYIVIDPGNNREELINDLTKFNIEFISGDSSIRIHGYF